MLSRFQSIVFAIAASAVAVASPAWAAPSPTDEAKPKPKPEAAGKPSGAPGTTPKDKGEPGRRPKAEAESEMGPEAAMTRATAYYEAGQYAQCADAFTAMLDDPDKLRALSPRSRELADAYAAACLIAVGKADAASERFRTAIRENPQMAVPSAVIFPPAVIERFVIVRSELMADIRRAEQERVTRERVAAEEARKRADAERRRVNMLEQLASEETVISKNSRWIASVPFGVGQFQNRDYALGTLFLVSESILAVTAITATALELRYLTEANGGSGFTDQTNVEDANRAIKATQIISLSATGALVLVAVGGIVQAHLGYVPEFRIGTRPRELPKIKQSTARTWSIQPSVTPQGGAIGFFGRF